MTVERLQLLADQLARSLDRAVIIDDASLRPLAVSAQLGTMDQSRIDAVLQRKTSAQLRRILDEHRVFQATDPVSIPAYEELGTLPRLCFPLVKHDQLRGFLWLINQPPLEPAEFGLTQEAAEHAAQLLHDRAVSAAEQLHTSRHLVDDLLGGAPTGIVEAARKLLRLGTLTTQRPYTLAVLRPTELTQQPDFERIYYELRQQLVPGTFEAATTRDTKLVIVLAAGSSKVVKLNPAGAVRDAVSGITEPTLAVGTGGWVDELTTVPSVLGRAMYASDVAIHIPEFNHAADWERLGAYAVLEPFRVDETVIDRICPGISAMLEANGMYETTARVYLDTACDAKATAESLHIHRSTLYWRLGKVEEILGVSLSGGNDRLRLHLALKLASLLRSHHESSG